MPYSFAALLNYKLPTSKMVREVCLEAKRYTGKELHAVGVVDILAEDGAGVLKAARALAAQRGELAKSGVWGLMKVCSTTNARRKHADCVAHVHRRTL